MIYRLDAVLSLSDRAHLGAPNPLSITMVLVLYKQPFLGETVSQLPDFLALTIFLPHRLQCSLGH